MRIKQEFSNRILLSIVLTIFIACISIGALVLVSEIAQYLGIY